MFIMMRESEEKLYENTHIRNRKIDFTPYHGG